jgi:hypothetical protein
MPCTSGDLARNKGVIPDNAVGFDNYSREKGLSISIEVYGCKLICCEEYK